MKTQIRYITRYSLQIFLLAFWLYAALDKLWGLKAFHIALQVQPFPTWWADILYWSLPIAELGIALLFLLPSVFSLIGLSNKGTTKLIATQKNSRHPEELGDVRIWGFSRSTPFFLSALLLLIFTIYIGLGVAGLYAKKPCGCASVFSGLSWKWHLLVNLVLLGMSILGWYLSGPTNPIDRDMRDNKSDKLFHFFLLLVAVSIYNMMLTVHRRFPRKFALFPIMPILHRPKYTFAVLPSKNIAGALVITPPR